VETSSTFAAKPLPDDLDFEIVPPKSAKWKTAQIGTVNRDGVDAVNCFF
jgi:hypothetical protein